jgi:hypothetical protein
MFQPGDIVGYSKEEQLKKKKIVERNKSHGVTMKLPYYFTISSSSENGSVVLDEHGNKYYMRNNRLILLSDGELKRLKMKNLF